MINKKSKKPVKRYRKPIQQKQTGTGGSAIQKNRINNTKKTRSNNTISTGPKKRVSNKSSSINHTYNSPTRKIKKGNKVRPKSSANHINKNQVRRPSPQQPRRSTPLQNQEQMRTRRRAAPQKSSQVRQRRRMTKREYLLRKRRRRALYNILACVMILGVICNFTISKITQYNEKPRAKYSTISKAITQKSKRWPSLIIKDEEVVSVQAAEGFFKKIKDEGNEVNKGDLVCITAKSNELFEQQEEKLNSDLQMFLLENRHSNFSYYLDELNNLDKNTYSIMQEFYSLEDKEAAASLLKYKLNNNIQLKTSIFLKQKSDLTKEIAQQRSFIVSEMNEYQQQHIAPVSGVLSYKIDGLEASLTNEKINEISYTEYNKYMKIESKDITMQPSEPIKNSPIFKIIKSNEWLAVAYLELANSADLEINKTYSLYAEEIPDKQIQVTLISIQDTDSGMIKLILKGTDQEALKYRTLTFTDRVESQIGLEIPSKSIIRKNLLKIDEDYINEDENGSFVIVKKDGIVNNVKVNIVCRADGYAYININELSINTELVTLDKSKCTTVTEIEEVCSILLKNQEDQPIRVDVITSMPDTTIIRMVDDISTKDKVVLNPEYFNS